MSSNFTVSERISNFEIEAAFMLHVGRAHDIPKDIYFINYHLVTVYNVD